MQRALWFQSGVRSCLLTACSAPRQGLASLPWTATSPQNPTAGLGGRTVPRGSHALQDHPRWGGHCSLVPLAEGFTLGGHGVQAQSSSGWTVDWDPTPTCTPNSWAAEQAPAVPKQGEWMPRMGQGPWQRGQLCVRLSPIHGPCRGSPPRNYSICHKIIEQGRSLPAPFPATLPEPSPCHCPRNPPGTGPTAGTAASSPSHSGTNSCPQLLQPRQSLSPCVAPCPGSPLIPAHSTSPPGAARTSQTHLRGFGVR